MVKDWYWGGRSSKGGGGAATEMPSGCMCAVFQFFDFHPFHFPINQQQGSFKSDSCIPEDQSVPKGAEAPRNSLESEDGTVSSISKEENLKIPKNIRIKTSGSTRARTGNLKDLSSEISSSPGTKTPTLVARLMGLDLLPDAHSSSSSSSSCLSTPNRIGNPHLHHLGPRQYIQIMKPRNSIESENAATRSLLETTKMSSARRSDVDHRLSLQINKENMGLGEELELPRFSFSKRKYEEHSSKSPSHYARQIVKQVKESASRKVGHDITNAVKKDQGGEECVGQFRFKKSPKTSVKSPDESSPGRHSNPSSSPRLRFLDTKHKPSTKPSPLTPKDQNTHAALKRPSPPPAVNIQAQLSRVLTKPKPQALPEQELQNQKSVPKCKKSTNEKYSPWLKKLPQTSDIIRNKQEESFIIRPPSPTRANDIKAKSKRTHPLPSNLLNNLNPVPNLLPVKTDPSPPATKIPQKQAQVSDTQESRRSTQLSSCSRQTNKQEATSTLATRGSNDEDKSNGDSTTGADDGPEFQYVTGILSRTGVYKCPNSTTTTVPHLQFQWVSPTHPLNPSIFHHVEQNPTSNPSISSPNNNQDSIFTPKNQLGPRCHRILLFDLVDEVLSEILTRPNKEKGKLWGLHDDCDVLRETVWKRIRSFPEVNYQVLKDIDGLIETEDMQKMKVGGAEALEEGEGLVADIEGNILETLVHETVMVMVMACGCSSGSVRRGRRRV